MTEEQDSRIGVGVIGGGWGAVYARAALRLPDLFRLSAISSATNEGRARLTAQFADAQPVIELDWRSLIARPDVQLVVIASPDHLHGEMTLAAIREQKHVLCEKPLVPTVAGAAALLSAAQTAGVQHFMGMLWRYSPAVAAMKDWVEAGDAGTIINVTGALRIGGPGPHRTWQLTRVGGVLNNLLVHMADLAHHLSSRDLEGAGRWSVWSQHDKGVPGVHAEGEETAWFHAQRGDRALSFDLIVSQDWARRTAHPLQLDVHGTQSSAALRVNPLDPASERWHILDKLSGVPRPMRLNSRSPAPKTEALPSAAAYLQPAAEEMLRCGVFPSIMKGIVCRRCPTFADGVRAQRFVGAAMDSSQRGCRVDIVM